MASLESLPPDQRAVLDLVLRRGRTYDQIAELLSIDRAGVRERALAAFDALGPQTGVPAQRRALITDYLLGALPSKVADDVRGRLAASPGERAWARVIASELQPLASSPLPEIPAESAAEPPAQAPAAVPTHAPPAGEPEPAAAASKTEATAAEPAAAAATAEPAAAAPPRAGKPAGPRTSRVGGALLLGAGAAIVIAVV